MAPAPAIEWKRGLEHLIIDTTLVDLPTLSEDELRENVDLLQKLETETSRQRRAMHGVIDRIEADLAARHTVGSS